MALFIANIDALALIVHDHRCANLRPQNTSTFDPFWVVLSRSFFFLVALSWAHPGILVLIAPAMDLSDFLFVHDGNASLGEVLDGICWRYRG